MLVHKGGQIKNWSGECRCHTHKIAASNYSKSTAKAKSAKGDYSEKKTTCFSHFHQIDLLIILYHSLTKFEAPSCNSFRDIMNTNFQSPNLKREIIKNKQTFFSIFHQLFSSSSSISCPSLKLLAVIVFEIS